MYFRVDINKILLFEMLDDILSEEFKASSHLKRPKNHFRYSRGYNLTHRKLFV